MSDSENAGSDQTEGVVLAVHLHDEETADAFKRLFEYLPDASMWAYDEYRTCDGCDEVRRIVQGGCCRECVEETLRADGGTSDRERSRTVLALRVLWVLFWSIVEWIGYKIRDFGRAWAKTARKIADLGGL